jgi:hypothetical protein
VERNAIWIYRAAVRRDGDSLICCELNLRERDAVEEMKRLGGFSTDANLVRTALYRLAVFFETNLDTSLFAVRNHLDRHAASVTKSRR